MLRLNRIERFLSIEKQHIKQVIKPSLKQVYQKYLHSYETRTTQQILATNQKIQKITQRNLGRLNKFNSAQFQQNKQKFNNCIFVCLSGIPPFQNQFQSLNLPGKTYQIVTNGFQFDKDDEYRQKNLHKCKLSQNAQKIHQLLEQHPKKDVVFVYHSFGTYNLSVYFQKYGTQRVKGLIEVGAAPVRQYLYITEVINHLLRFSQEDIRSNKDQVAGKRMNELMDRMNKELNIKWDLFPSITYAKSFLHYFKSPQTSILFDLNRRYPNILKLMIFGQDDNLFQRQLICERAHFYSQQKLTNQNQLKKKFQQKWQNTITTQNIQQEFIYMIPKGKHSLHLQKRNQPILSKAVQQYLELIFD